VAVFSFRHTIITIPVLSLVSALSIQNQLNGKQFFYEADSRSAGQEISCFVWNPDAQYRIKQDPVTGSYPEPDESSSRLHTLFLLRCNLMLSSHLRLGLPSVLFLFVFFFPD
jgi:hypothetical protein